MSVLVNLQPNARTTARSVQSHMEPPSLVIYDGTATVFFSPASMPGGVLAAAVFARELAGAVARWEASCRQAASLAQSSDPLQVDELVSRLGDEAG